MGSSLKKIIYTDDIHYHLMSIKARFQDHYEIYPSQSVEAMFEILDRVNVDLILLDVNMPDMNGFEGITKIKADKRYSNIPVILVSSQNDRKYIIKGMTLGAADFITKPFSNEQFIECIEYQFDEKKQEANKPIVLAIDDSPSILKAVNLILENQCTVYTMSEVKGEQVLNELLKKIIPDLFLLDYNMPGLTGFDLIPIIRKNPDHVETPIVFLTSEGTMDNVSVALNLGVRDFISKPIDRSFLRKTARTLRMRKQAL